MKKKISFQGMSGAFSDLVCRKFYRDFETMPCTNFEETLNAVSKHNCELALIPVENNIAGRVADFHFLLEDLSLKIVDEHYHKIEHHLMIKNSKKIKDLKKVYSHIHALSQCKKNIKSQKLIPVNFIDTAAAAKYVSETIDNKSAAIASRLASKIYNLEIIKENFEDKQDNVTRFLVFARKSKKIPINKKVITTIVFETKNLPACLYKALGGFANNNINLTRLESFFVNRDFKQFSFLVDVECHPEKESFRNAIKELKKYSYKIKILGFYRASPFRK